MSNYVKNATAEAEAYEQERKKQAEDAVKQQNAAAAAAAQAAGAETAAAIREQERARLDTVDTAAVQRAITDKQVRERLAALGLSASGMQQASGHAAAVTERRSGQRAQRTRDEAVRALTEALTRTEQEIERERAAAESKTLTDAAEDSAKKRESLLKAAYAAEAREVAARESAAARVEAARIKAETAGMSTSAKERMAEDNRRNALKMMYENYEITDELYALALDNGWSVEETVRQSRRYERYLKVADEAFRRYADQGFEAMMRYVAPYDLSDVEWDELCYRLNLSRPRVDKWLAGFHAYIESTPNAEAVLELFERGSKS